MILVSHCKQILFQLLSGCAHLGSEDDSCVAGCPVEKGISWCRKVYGRAVLNFCPCLAGCGCLLYNSLSVPLPVMLKIGMEMRGLVNFCCPTVAIVGKVSLHPYRYLDLLLFTCFHPHG